MLPSLKTRLRRCLVFASILRAHGSMSSGVSHDWSRYENALDAVDINAAPRVQLLHPLAPSAPGGSPAPLDSLAVLDSSFNPPTRAHLHMLHAACEHFGLQRRLLLLAKQNADKASLAFESSRLPLVR